jgi:hypothetical protein
MSLNESTVEDAALTWFGEQDFRQQHGGADAVDTR